MASLTTSDSSRAVVYKGDEPAGELVRDRDDVFFQYFEDYLAGNGRAVATTLPKSDVPFRTHGGAVPAFFAGLLPEGRRLSAIKSTLKTSADDEFSMVVAVGSDCIGDVRVIAEGSAPETVIPSFDRPEDVSFAELLDSTFHEDQVLRQSSIPGVQGKIASEMISLPIHAASGAAILKLTPSAYPLLVENEAYFLDMARAAGLKVPTFSLVADREGQNGLVVDRFDRLRRADGTIIRIAQEDATQLAGRWPAAKYKMSAKDVFHVVRNVASAKPVAMEALLRQFVFSYAIGNGDLHAKNVSVYFHPEGVWSVTPAYDLVCTIPYGDDSMALNFGGRDKNIRGSMFVDFAERQGLRDQVSRRVIEEVIEGITPLIDSVDSIGFDERKTTRMMHVMRERVHDLRK